MRFRQIDKITLLEPGSRIEASHTVRGDEDYLRDHFPRFPVMPGVLMLEALYQASALLVRATENHEAGLVILREARNVKFADFVQPGQTLQIQAEIIKQEDQRYVLKANGLKEGQLAVGGRLVVECLPDDQAEIVAKHAALFMRRLTEQLQQAAMASQ